MTGTFRTTLLSFFAVILMACTTSQTEMKAEGRSYYLQYVVMEYRPSLGGLAGYSWQNIGLEIHEEDNLPVVYGSECRDTLTPSPYPTIWDRYCDTRVLEYYLIFEGRNVKTTKEIFDGYSPEKVYSVKTINDIPVGIIK